MMTDARNTKARRITVKKLQTVLSRLIDREGDLKMIIEHYGNLHQEFKLAEEMGELHRALARCWSGPYDYDAYNNECEEIADVLIVLSQLLTYGCLPSGLIVRIIDEKIDRTLERIGNEDKSGVR